MKSQKAYDYQNKPIINLIGWQVYEARNLEFEGERMKKEFIDIDLSNEDKANYLSRLFGIFYEGVIEFCWKSQGFMSIGRPSVYTKKDKYLQKTFDYTLKKGSKHFIAEAKSYMAYTGFSFMDLTLDLLRNEFFDRLDKSAFQFFLELDKERPYEDYTFKYGPEKIPFQPDGKILIWTRVKKDEAMKIKEEYHFSYVFSLEKMIMDMVSRIKDKSENGKQYEKYLNKRKRWANEIFNALLGKII